MITQDFSDQEAFLLVDISYCLHALAHTALNEYATEFDVPDDQEELFKIDFSTHPEYLAILSRCIVTNIRKYAKQFNVKIRDIILCADCPKRDIWRMSIYPNYKLHRLIQEPKGLNKGPLFKFLFDKLIPNLMERKFCKLLRYHCAEGDDIIAISHKYIREKYPTTKIIIVGSDHDLMQLIDDKTYLVNIQNQLLNEKSEGSKKDLYLKILLGDTSDNIHSVFEKTKGDKHLAKGFGVKTAKLFRDDVKLLKEKLEQYPAAKEKLKLNTQLVDFKYIPALVQNGILEEIKKVLI